VPLELTHHRALPSGLLVLEYAVRKPVTSVGVLTFAL
jgi:hypothetical protein